MEERIMKHRAIIVSILVLFVAFGVTGSYAQQTDPGQNPMAHGAGMDMDKGCGCGKMGGMEMSKGCGCGKMGGMEMSKSCGCGEMGSGEMGGMMRKGMMEHMGMMPEDMMEARHHVMRMLMHLNLDEKQKSAVHEIIGKTARDSIKKRSDLLLARMDLEDIIHKDPIDINAAESKLKQIEAMKTDAFVAHLKAFEEIKSLLTPEQKKKLKEMIENHMMGGMGMAGGCSCSMMEEKETPHHMKKME
jgi:Spy/CpxP family protein refolding chaperone